MPFCKSSARAVLFLPSRLPAVLTPLPLRSLLRVSASSPVLVGSRFGMPASYLRFFRFPCISFRALPTVRWVRRPVAPGCCTAHPRCSLLSRLRYRGRGCWFPFFLPRLFLFCSSSYVSQPFSRSLWDSAWLMIGSFNSCSI